MDLWMIFLLPVSWWNINFCKALLWARQILLIFSDFDVTYRRKKTMTKTGHFFLLQLSDIQLIFRLQCQKLLQLKAFKNAHFEVSFCLILSIYLKFILFPYFWAIFWKIQWTLWIWNLSIWSINTFLSTFKLKD